MSLSKTAWFKAAHGKQVLKHVSGVGTQEDIPELVETWTAQLLEQGVKPEEIEVRDGALYVGSRFWMLPTFKKEVLSVMEMRSRDYIHDGVYGNKTDAMIDTDGNMFKNIPNSIGGKITYIIQEG